MLTEDDAAREGSAVALAAVTGDIKERLVEFQKQFLVPLMQNFDLRIKSPASEHKLKVLFDFRKMPWDRTDSEQTTGLLLALGNAEAEWIVGALFPELDGFELKSEALAARMFVFEHQDEFRVLVDPKKPEEGRRLCLFTIYERLYSRDVCNKPIPSFLHVPEYVISFMWQSCNSERAGSHINRVKTPERIGLLKDSFNSLVFGTFNNPPVHELDTPRLVFKWRS